MHDDVKRDNRKALPKFLLILLGSAVFGGVLGFLTGWMGYSAGTLWRRRRTPSSAG